MGPMTLVEMLERHAVKTPGKLAIIFHNNRMTYRELNDTVNKLANFFLEKGLRKGDRVCLMLPRIPELIIGFLAVTKAHGIAVPVNFELGQESIKDILMRISPRYLIVHSSFLEIAKKSVPDSFYTEIIATDGEDAEGISLTDILNKGNTNNPGLDIKSNDVVYFNYTSGSTGDSKGAITTHDNIYWNTFASVEALGLTKDDVHLCMFAPFAHPHEIFARPLYLGGTMILVDKIYPKSLAEAISTHKVTCMMGLAPMYENLLELLEYKNYDLRSLRIPESGGMYTREELIKRFTQKIGVPIVPVWGSTETTGIAIANRPNGYIPAGSVGKPCLYYEAKIVDEDGIELPPGEIGEMIFKGPAVVGGYYETLMSQRDTKDNENNPPIPPFEKGGIKGGFERVFSGQSIGNNAQCFKNGWYYSGDLGRKDEEGNFYFVERKTGMMKVAGLKVYPLEIELALMSHPDVKEAVVIPVKDRLRGEVPKAIVVSRNGNGLTAKDVLGFCKEKLPHYKLPKIVEIRESLPKIGSGKINKKILQMEHA